MKILHLSDLHFQIEKKGEYTELFDLLYNDLVNFHTIDFIFVTGDLVDKFGNGNFENSIIDITSLIYSLASRLSIRENQVIIIPGNHEVNKDKFSFIKQQEIKEFIYLDVRNSTDLLLNMEKTYSSDNVINAEFKQLEDFHIFANETFDFSSCVFRTPLFSCYKHVVNEEKIGVLCLNNVWYSELHKENYGQIMMGVHQITEGIQWIKDCKVKIAISHFSLSYHHDIERAIIENKIIEHFDIYLTGHSHYSNNNIVQKSNGITCTSCLISAAPAFNYLNYFSDSSKYSLGYDLIDIYNNDIRINHRVYSGKNSRFVSNTQIASDGVSKYKLQIEDINNVITMRDILLEQKDQFDKLLISNSIETNAPKSVDTLFISPVLFSINVKDEKDKVKAIDYSEIFENNGNLIVFGSKESGKSTLLYSIFSDYLNFSLETNIYPLYIDLSSVAEENFISILKKGYPCIEKFVTNRELVLLIDNLNIKNEKLVCSISDYIKTIRCKKVIITSDLMVSGEIPLEFYDSLISNYSTIKIRPLTIEKVKNLTKMWFSEKGQYDDKVIDKIIGFAKENYVPTYPIYVSMFLWLSEQKKNVASFSNAMLIENFIEKLLEKHSPQQYIYSDFDYNNKKILLTEIAEAIHVNHGMDIGYNDFYNLIIKHLTIRNFPFKVDKIADDLISSGILIHKNDNVGFRYYCVYTYFRSLKLNSDADYLSKILDSDEIFYYIEEIDIMTALHRDRTDIINKVSTRLFEMLDKARIFTGLKLDDIDSFFKREAMLVPLISERMMSPEARAIKQEVKRKNTDKLIAASEEHNDKKMLKRYGNLTGIHQLERIWVLAARVLKNLDEYKENDKKLLLLDKILDCAIYFVYLFNYSFFEKYFSDEKNGDDSEFLKFMIIQFLLMPYALETFFQMNIGSVKLQNIFKEYMEIYLKKDEIEKSNIKSFIVNFLLIDNNCFIPQQFKKYIRELQIGYIIDNVFLKLNELYLESSQNEDFYHDSLKTVMYLNKNWKEKQEIDKKLIELKKNKMLKDMKSDL